MKIIINCFFNQIKLARPLHLDHVGVCLSIVLFGWVLYFLSEKIGLCLGFNPDWIYDRREGRCTGLVVRAFSN